MGFLMRHPRLHFALHRLLHRQRDRACLLCRAVWRYLERDPAFVEGIEAGLADLRAGRLIQWHDV